MNRDMYRILGITILFSLMILGVLANTGMKLAQEYFSPTSIMLPIEKNKLIPALVVPTPNKGYFVECMTGDMAIVTANENENVYYYWCNRGTWEIKNDQDNRNYELPKPQRDHTGAL